MVVAKQEVPLFIDVNSHPQLLCENLQPLGSQGVQLGKGDSMAVYRCTVKILVHLVAAIMQPGDGVESDFVRNVPSDAQTPLAHIVASRLYFIRQVFKRIVAIEAWVLWRNLASVFNPVVGQDGVKVIRWRPAQGKRGAGKVYVASALIQGGVVVVALPRTLCAAYLQRQGVFYQRQIESYLNTVRVIGAHFVTGIQAIVIELGAHPVHHYIAAYAVLAEEHALRPTVDFHTLNVEDINQLPSAGAYLYAIHYDPYLRALGFFNIRIAYASNVECRCARPSGVHADIDIGGKAVKLPQGSGLELLYALRAEGSHRQRHILLRFVLAP